MFGERKQAMRLPRGIVAGCAFGIDLNRAFRHKPATCAALTGGDDLLHDRLGWPDVPWGRCGGRAEQGPGDGP
ncbi:hypothetical protein DWE98_08005 [Bosea caraganae]|uniref:Uncharacterized protein n=1 Tax=Bosea caraganae TaxID=2763117 RepID=A0A370L957_9HYPH|nr:hypothetical protein DWE98_08005 [Bosea caraganae]